MLLGRRRLAGLLLPAATLLALAGVCFARLLADPSALIVDGRRPSIDYANRGDPRPIGNDLIFLFLPHHGSIGRRLAQFGHWPFWDARGFAGRPLAGNPQSGMFYLPVWAAWRLQAPAALGWLTVGHLLWGGLGVYVLVRSMGPGRWAATVAAGTYQASPLLLAHTFEGHYPHVWAACWYPWAFWAAAEHRCGRPRGRLLLPPILVLTFLTGHPQEWLLLVLALTVWAAADGLKAWPGRGPRRSAAGIATWVGMLALSIGMAGVEVAPQWAVRPWLRREHDPSLEPGIPRRYHLGALNGFQLLSPTALGGPSDYFGDDNYWETVFSIGFAPLVLAVIAAARHPDRSLVRGWVLLAGLAVWFACGRSLGCYPLIYSTVPGMGWFRVPARSLFLANLAGAVLAGLGIETLRTRFRKPRAWRRLAVRLAGVLAVGVVILFAIQLGHPGGHSAGGRLRDRMSGRMGPRLELPADREPVRARRPPLDPPRTWRAATRLLHDGGFGLALCGLAALCFLGCVPSGRRNPRRAAGLMGLLAMAELGWSGCALIQVAPAVRFLGPDSIGAAFARGASGVGPCRDTPPRIKARDAFYGDLPAAAHGLEKTNVTDAFQLDHAAVLYEVLYPLASRVRPRVEVLLSRSAKESWRRIRQAVCDRMSVTHLVSDRIESDPSWPVAAQGSWNGSRLVIQRNPTAMPRAYVVPRVTILPDHAGVILTAMADLDPRDSVLMSRDPLGSVPPGPRQPFTTVDWAATDPDRPALRVTTWAPGLLVVADTWMPGWTASVDGRPAPVLRGNYAQRVIPLPEPGRHTIVMDYRPPGFAIGAAITVVSTLAWTLMVVWGRPSARRRDTRPGTEAPGAERPDPPRRSPPEWHRRRIPSPGGAALGRTRRT